MRFLHVESTKVDEANVDTPSHVESSTQWIWVTKAWLGEQLRIKTKGFEIVESEVEECVDVVLGIEYSLLPYLVL